MILRTTFSDTPVLSTALILRYPYLPLESANAPATSALSVYGQINVYGVTTKSERHKRSYWTRTADGNGIGGRKAPVPYGS